jgi:EAL domain-containing protein (putative c-di-GMP-specific phosphodiesterase class I)
VSETFRQGREYVEAAVRARAFSLVYQPIVDLDTGQLLGVEGLCRFHDGRPPDVWFDECEQLGMAMPMDLAVLDLAMQDLDHLPTGYLSLNLSIASLAAGDALLRILRPALARRPVVLELSERVIVRDYDAMLEQLAPLRDAGLLLAVDDAGAGYSSVQHIVRLRPDMFKLDRAFVSSIDRDSARRAFALAAVVLARELGSPVVAEGVETASELRTLRRAGITAAQGYYLGRPQRLPLDALDYVPQVPLDLRTEGAPPAVVAAGVDRSMNAIQHATDRLRRLTVARDQERRHSICDEIDREIAYLRRAVADMSSRYADVGGARSAGVSEIAGFPERESFTCG